MFKFLKAASTASLCGALLMIAPASEASIVNYTFSGVVDSGLFVGETYNGSFAYDNLMLTNSGNESINLSTLTFNFLSNAFILANEEFASTADFLDGVFLGVNYSVSGFEPTFALGSGSVTGLLGDAQFSYQPVNGDSGYGSLNYAAGVTVVPAPAAVWLFSSALAGLGVINRRKRQHTVIG